jgi:hypothetical protein
LILINALIAINFQNRRECGSNPSVCDKSPITLIDLVAAVMSRLSLHLQASEACPANVAKLMNS